MEWSCRGGMCRVMVGEGLFGGLSEFARRMSLQICYVSVQHSI